jgi:hypothetical protein
VGISLIELGFKKMPDNLNRVKVRRGLLLTFLSLPSQYLKRLLASTLKSQLLKSFSLLLLALIMAETELDNLSGYFASTRSKCVVEIEVQALGSVSDFDRMTSMYEKTITSSPVSVMHQGSRPPSGTSWRFSRSRDKSQKSRKRCRSVCDRFFVAYVILQ